MDKEEFKKLAEKSGLQKNELASILGVGRQTIHNWITGEKIPGTKHDFIRSTLSKDPSMLKMFLSENSGLSVESSLPFVVSNFDLYMEYEEFQVKVFTKAYNLAKEIISEKESKA